MSKLKIMIKTIFFILVCYGISNIIVFGSLFDGMRKYFDKINPDFLGGLVGCMMCTSFWVGFMVSMLYSPTVDIIGLSDTSISLLFITVFLDACFASGTVWLVHNFEEMLERAFKE